jgi:hypothetical protein
LLSRTELPQQPVERLAVVISHRLELDSNALAIVAAPDNLALDLGYRSRGLHRLWQRQFKAEFFSKLELG